MTTVYKSILEQVIAATAEPLIVVRIDRPDWPVLLANPAFGRISAAEVSKRPFADVIEEVAGREVAIEVSEAVRLQQETSFPVEAEGREYLLILKPLSLPGQDAARFFVALWRVGAADGTLESAEMHQALLSAKRRVQDLKRDDPVTGLLKRRAFREVFEHDWAVAAREKSQLSLVAFTIDEFDDYVAVFGRHAADTCLRRVGQAIRRFLRRASDVVARPGGALFLVLSHASDEAGVNEFAERIAAAVRELGLHHPRSMTSRFVTISFAVTVVEPCKDEQSAAQVLGSLPEWEAD